MITDEDHLPEIPSEDQFNGAIQRAYGRIKTLGLGPRDAMLHLKHVCALLLPGPFEQPNPAVVMSSPKSDSPVAAGKVPGELVERLKDDLQYLKGIMPYQNWDSIVNAIAYLTTATPTPASEREAALEKEKADFHLAYRTKCDVESKAAIQRAETAEARLHVAEQEVATLKARGESFRRACNNWKSLYDQLVQSRAPAAQATPPAPTGMQAKEEDNLAGAELMRPGWVAVEDALPPFGVPVWLYLPDIGQPLIGSRDDDAEGWLWSRLYDDFHFSKVQGKWMADGGESDDLKPSHWMHLPQPPTQGLSSRNPNPSSAAAPTAGDGEALLDWLEETGNRLHGWICDWAKEGAARLLLRQDPHALHRTPRSAIRAAMVAMQSTAPVGGEEKAHE